MIYVLYTGYGLYVSFKTVDFFIRALRSHSNAFSRGIYTDTVLSTTIRFEEIVAYPEEYQNRSNFLKFEKLC